MPVVSKQWPLMLAQQFVGMVNEAVENLPACTAAKHDWSVVRDKTVVEQFGAATITTTYSAAVVCGNCNFTIGF